jgi:predicted Ser/Thr protein kinase
MASSGGTIERPDETACAAESTGHRRDLGPGASLGKYRLDRILGSGGMGVVWAAHDPDLERAVALKVLLADNAAPELRRRLLREARAMARLKHPNVLTVYEVDSEGDRDFIAMELVEGASLDRWREAGPSRDEIWQAVLAAGRGLAAAHRAGLVHRDFKPHNVLRSHDGRVLVTDFGLARGHAEEPAAIGTEVTLPVQLSGHEATLDATPRSDGSALDAPLTQTGAVLGTPAYMAPEQFLGAASDQRTDQFAYCVTAWQLFVGERPFRGATIDELRRAASGGVANLKVELPRAIRAVLARGLEADPSKRWPDMNALLAALERAKAVPRRRLRIGVSGVALGLSAVLAFKLARDRSTVADSSVCEIAPEDEIQKAWSPALRAGLALRFGDPPAVRYVADELDAFAARWLDDYRSACASPRTTRTFAKLGCLLGERDEVAGITELVSAVPVSGIEDVEMGGVLPRPQACDGDSPVMPPTLPDDPAKRSRIQALRPRLLVARFVPGAEILPAMPGLLREAEAIGWDPIIAEAHQSFAIAAQRDKKWELARDHFKTANQVARRSHHYHLEADTWIGLLQGEFEAATDPADGSEFLDLVAQARVAAHNAGDDPVYLGRIVQLEASFASARGRLDDALAKDAQARALVLSARDVAGAMRIAINAADALLARNRPDDLAAAWATLLEAEQVAARARLTEDKRRLLASMLSLTAWLRGDLAGAHAWADRADPSRLPADAVAHAGRVIDADGKAVAGATVVAWRGTLEADATRVQGRSRFEGDVATTDADGRFTVRAVRDGGIIAELGPRRSSPRMVGEGAITLALEPTREIAGRVADDELPPGIVAIAHYALGRAAAWNCASPVERSHGYVLAGLPSGAATLRLDRRLDPNRPVRKLDFGPIRSGAEPRWPIGPSIDAIIHGGSSSLAPIYVLRGRRSARTRAELDELFDSASEALIHPALVVGVGDQTTEGMKYYARGDSHAVFLGNAPGSVTVCATDAEPTSPATCQAIEIPSTPAEVRDGRPVYPAIAVVFPR